MQVLVIFELLTRSTQFDVISYRSFEVKKVLKDAVQITEKQMKDVIGCKVHQSFNLFPLAAYKELFSKHSYYMYLHIDENYPTSEQWYC